MIRRILSFAALPCLAAATVAAAECTSARTGWDDPVLRMTVDVEKGDATLIIEGQIGPDAPQRLKAMLADRPDIGAIHFNSSGGDVASAIEAGRMLRSAGNFMTHVPAGARCTDACAFLFLSGRIRSVDPAAVFDLGRFYDTGGAPMSAADIARQSLEQSDYLIRMGVTRRLLTRTLDRHTVHGTEAMTRMCLTPDEIHGYNVANWNE